MILPGNFGRILALYRMSDVNALFYRERILEGDNAARDCAWCSMSADQATDELHLWLWEYTDEIGKRRRSTWRMTEAEAAHYKDAVKV